MSDTRKIRRKVEEFLSQHLKSDGIEYSRGAGDECMTCHSRSIRYERARRYCNHCEQLDRLRAEKAVLCDYLMDRMELRWDDELLRIVSEYRDAVREKGV